MLERIKNGRTDLVFELATSGGGTRSDPGELADLLRWCAYYGDVSAVRFLLGRGGTVEALGDNLDLNGAAFHGHWRLCEFLLEQGADPNHTLADTGETALHAALCTPNRPGHDLVVQVLLAAGADPNRATSPGVETGCFMRDCRTKGETALHRAGAFAGEATLRRLLEAGAQVDARDMHGDTPLAWASWHLRPDAILRLLCYGEHSIHPERDASGDHGQGRSAMEVYLLGKPVVG